MTGYIVKHNYLGAYPNPLTVCGCIFNPESYIFLRAGSTEPTIVAEIFLRLESGYKCYLMIIEIHTTYFIVCCVSGRFIKFLQALRNIKLIIFKQGNNITL